MATLKRERISATLRLSSGYVFSRNWLSVIVRSCAWFAFLTRYRGSQPSAGSSRVTV